VKPDEVPRAVLDTSVLVPDRVRRALVAAARADQFEGIISPHIIGELYRVLTVIGIRRARGFSPALGRQLSRDSKALMSILLNDFELWNTEPPYDPPVTSDPDDHHLMLAARRAQAQFVVSNDDNNYPSADSMGLHVVDGIEFLSSNSFSLRLNERARVRGS
jgi:predicted nucleic acid-binding protein